MGCCASKANDGNTTNKNTTDGNNVGGGGGGTGGMEGSGVDARYYPNPQVNLIIKLCVCVRIFVKITSLRMMSSSVCIHIINYGPIFKAIYTCTKRSDSLG